MAESRPATHRLVERMHAAGGDVLMVLGDTYAMDEGILDECLALFARFPGPKLLAAGNHDLWTRDRQRDSRHILDEAMPCVAARHGFHMLDHAPFVHQDVGFVGGCGWYDYSFRDETLNIPIEFYRLKMAPGVVSRMDPGRQLDLPWDKLEPRHYRVCTVWNDVAYVRWADDDERFTDRVVEKLGEHLASVAPQVRAVVCGTHHIPFAEMVVHKKSASWAFGNAFMGSRRMGEALLACAKVRAAFFGHSHTAGRKTVGHIEAINVGSTYREKYFVELEV